MFDFWIEDLWHDLQKSGLLTGAWSGLEYKKLPKEVRDRFRETVEPTFDRIAEFYTPDDF